MSERVILVGVVTPFQDQAVVEDHLEELDELVGTLGYAVVDHYIVQRKKISPALYIGKGKVNDIGTLISAMKIDVVIFDDDLSPTQSRNLETSLKIEVIDRSAVILEIFAKHARTKEAKTQVELATLEYLLPRLTRRWTHLERQIGGTRTRSGAGETQIEVDRRLIRTRIARLRKDLIRIDRERAIQRKGRENFFQVALVGYTNTGKSTLMNALTDSAVFVANKLFATLDTTVRQWNVDKYYQVLLSDTVGFIRKLPPNLVASFRSTLQEAREADLLLKVIDISNSHCLEQLATVDEILIQLQLYSIPALIVFNKIDQADPSQLNLIKRDYPDAIYLSALHSLRIDDLKNKILRELRSEEVIVTVEVSLNRTKTIALLRDNCRIIDQVFEDNSVRLKGLCYRRIWDWLQQRLADDVSIM